MKMILRPLPFLSSVMVVLFIVFLGVRQTSMLAPTQMEQDSPLLNQRSANKCQIVPIGACTFWNRTVPEPGRKSSWVWTNSCPPSRGYALNTTRKEIIVPRINGTIRRLDEITNNQTSFVFFGSSHIRELYKEFIRLHNGFDFNKVLSRQVNMVHSGVKNMACDPNRTGYKDGLYGVDLDACGLPGRRMIPELGERVAIGFKTFLHTPIADESFVDWLAMQALRYPQVIVTDVGVWGPRGKKVTAELNYTITLNEEIDYNLNWLRTTFPTSAIIFIVEHQFYDIGIEPSVNPRLLEFVKKDKRSVLVRKDLIMQQMPARMKCDHGCSGPVLVVIVHLILDWLEAEKKRNSGECIV